MKKTVAFLLAFVLVFSSMMTVFAEDSPPKPIVSFGSATFTEVGETQTMIVSAKNLKEVTVMQFVINYDSEKLELLNVATEEDTEHYTGEVIGAAAEGRSIIPKATVSGHIPGEISVVWESITPVSGSGILVELQFKSKVANAGEIKLEVNKDEDVIVRQDTIIDETTKVPGTVVEIETTNEPIELGVKVSGSFTSYLKADGTVTVELYKAEAAEPAYKTTATGNTGTYSIENVEAGTYTMKVSKAGHATFEETVVVSDADVTKDVTLYRYGDVDGDEQITSYDASLILQYVVGNIGENDLVIIVADVDDDKQITSYDASLILQYVVGNINKFPVE